MVIVVILHLFVVKCCFVIGLKGTCLRPFAYLVQFCILIVICPPLIEQVDLFTFVCGLSSLFTFDKIIVC